MGNDPRNQSGGMFANVSEEFKVKSGTAIVGFDVDQVEPAAQQYIGVDDQLFTSFIGQGNGGALNINIRILRPDGIIVPLKILVPAYSGVAPKIQTFPLLEGFLLSLAVSPISLNSSGQAPYVLIGLSRNPNTVTDVYCVLCAGYLWNSQPFGWPDNPPIRETDGPGFLLMSNTNPPGAGADFSFSVPVGERFRIITVTGVLTTSAAVANRDVTLVFDDGANVYATIPAGFALAASLINTYTFGDSLVQSPAFNGVSIAPLPSQMILPAGHRVRSVTANIQAADQWTLTRVYAQFWFESI